MAVIITNSGVPTGTFRMNGKLFNKVYQPVRSGSSNVGIYNTYDTRLQLLGPTDFSEFTINGSTYLTQEEVVEALLPVVYIDAGAAPAVEVWGDLTGTLSNQTDLQAALDAKQNVGAFAAWADITGKPTTISGFGITDAYTKAEADGKYALLTDSRFLTSLQLTDLTDAGDSTLHYHATDRARANHTGTQAISTVTGLQTELDGKVPTTRNLTAGTGISGGGNLTLDRSFSLDTSYTDDRYVLRTGSATISGTHTYSSRPVFNGGLSGSTSPFTVDSTTVVTNLNADLLDGFQATQFLRADASDVTTGELTAAAFKTGLWTIDVDGTNQLVFKYNGTTVITFKTDGGATFDGNVFAG